MLVALIASIYHQPRPFEMDFALVADPAVNRNLISETSLESTQADKQLLSYMKGQANGRQFAILDGSTPLGDILSRPNWSVDVSTYSTSSYESASATVNGVKVASEQTKQEIGTRSVTKLGAVGPEHSSFAVAPVHDPSTKALLFAVMPLVALRSNSTDLSSYRQVGLFVTPQSTHEARMMAEDFKTQNSPIVICRWGTQRPEAPNFISFPQPGQFKHYKVGYDGKTWYARLSRIVPF